MACRPCALDVRLPLSSTIRIAVVGASKRPHTAVMMAVPFLFSSRRRHTRFDCDWSSDVCSSDLVDGNIKGNIISEQTVILGEGAKVEGQIEGNRVVISGRFDGVIFAKGRVEIEAKGVVTGEVHSPCMVIDPGGIFDGRCHMLASSDAASSVTIPIRPASTA